MALKISVVVAIALPCMAFAADWDPVANRNSLGTAFFVDTDSVVDNDPIVTITVLEDRLRSKAFKVNGINISYRSYISRRYILCTKKQSVIEQGVYYSGRMGSGRAVYKFKDEVDKESFSSIATNTWAEALFEYVCDGSKPLHRVT
jgi:hypothetical protein